jgi:hypothetical protein
MLSRPTLPRPLNLLLLLLLQVLLVRFPYQRNIGGWAQDLSKMTDLHPFHLVMDSNLNLVQYGSGVQRLFPEMKPGVHASEHFRVRRCVCVCVCVCACVCVVHACVCMRVCACVCCSFALSTWSGSLLAAIILWLGPSSMPCFNPPLPRSLTHSLTHSLQVCHPHLEAFTWKAIQLDVHSPFLLKSVGLTGKLPLQLKGQMIIRPVRLGERGRRRRG